MDGAAKVLVLEERVSEVELTNIPNGRYSLLVNLVRTPGRSQFTNGSESCAHVEHSGDYSRGGYAPVMAVLIGTHIRSAQ